MKAQISFILRTYIETHSCTDWIRHPIKWTEWQMITTTTNIMILTLQLKQPLCQTGISWKCSPPLTEVSLPETTKKLFKSKAIARYTLCSMHDFYRLPIFPSLPLGKSSMENWEKLPVERTAPALAITLSFKKKEIEQINMANLNFTSLFQPAHTWVKIVSPVFSFTCDFGNCTYNEWEASAANIFFHDHTRMSKLMRIFYRTP